MVVAVVTDRWLRTFRYVGDGMVRVAYTEAGRVSQTTFCYIPAPWADEMIDASERMAAKNPGRYRVYR